MAAVVVLAVGVSLAAHGGQEAKGVVKVGGFRCVDLKPLRNDRTFDLYSIGYFCNASFRMDIWKRHGVPYLYQRDTGDIRIAGADWKPPMVPTVSSAGQGAIANADRQEPGNGAIANANDGDKGTYWYSGNDHPSGKLWIDFEKPARVDTIRFLGWATPRHAPADYSVGLIMQDGSRREVAAVHDEKRMGEWIEFDAGRTIAKGIYLDVRRTMEAQHGPVIYEFQAIGDAVLEGPMFPAEATIPVGGTAAEELLFLGQVGEGFDASYGVETPVGEYVVRYSDGRTETIPLIAGRNVADIRYGYFVSEAEFAFGFKDPERPGATAPAASYYHLDSMLPVDPHRQLMTFSHRTTHPRTPIESIVFRCTRTSASLILAGLTLRQSGARMNALAYNGKTVHPYPKDTPKAEPSLVAAMIDRSRVLPLDGKWRYAVDPGNRGVRESWFDARRDLVGWKEMPVPSQWYVQGLDYHGVVWFSRDIDVPESFPGSVLELNFGGADYDARVWVNGEYIGRHTGAFSSFKMDATKSIRRGAKNRITVRVDSPIDPGYSPQKTIVKGNSQDDIAMPYNEEGCSGGIFRTVTLTGRGDVGIEDVMPVTTVSDDLKRAKVTVKLGLSTPGSSLDGLTVRCTLTEPQGGHGAPRSFTKSQTLSGSILEPVELTFDVRDPMLWYPWEQGTPYLHTMVIEVMRGEEVLDTHVSRVGIREVSFDDKAHCVHVNHHRIFIKGMLNDDIHWMSMMDRTGYRQRIQLQKDANLNLIRMVGHQSSPDMYDLCDEMGMMVWQEMPLQWGYSSSEPVRKDIVSVVKETVLQCRPHASVVGWSAWNEGGQQGFSEQITDTIRNLDNTRPMTKACGLDDFDIHIYPNITPAAMSRRTFFWTGLRLGFVSEVGAYGLSSLDEIREMIGDDLFHFDSAEYFWETFNSYRWNDGPVFWDSPFNGYWTTEQVRDYVLKKIAPSERWLMQFMKFMYENFRAQRFDPTTAAIHCRFDDALPTAYLGVVNFNGRPRKAYYSVQEACRQVLPIIFFDYTGVGDVRVINEYWRRSWTDCTLKYRVTDRNGKVIKSLDKPFSLPADSTVTVLSREEAGDLFHIPGGFLAELTVLDENGKPISHNHYDLTSEEAEAFVTSVLPVPPTKPFDGILVEAADAVESQGVVRKVESLDTYSSSLMELDAASVSSLRFAVDVPSDGDYLIRVAGNFGLKIRAFECTANGHKLEPESYPYTDMELGMTRLPYSEQRLSWFPGWTARLKKGPNALEFRLPAGKASGTLILDAVCVQPSGSIEHPESASDRHAGGETVDNKAK